MDAVGVTHALVLVAQVVAGLAWSDAPALWLRSYIELALGLCVSLVLLASTADAAFSRFRRLQARAPPAKRVAEAVESCRAMFVFSGFAAWPRSLLALGRPTALRWTLASAQPEAPSSLALYALKLLFVTLLVDLYMYAKHRALHSRSLFKYHKQHHAFVNPTPFAAFAVAPVEAALTFAPVLALCLPEAPVWAAAYAVWTTGFVLLNMYLHAGVVVPALEALRVTGLNTSGFHNWHHECGGRENFGELLYVWDYLLATGDHPQRDGPRDEKQRSS